MQTLVVGLGNPGANYANNRHNVGFMAVDRMWDEWRGAPWRKKFQGEVAEASVGGARTLFLKPATYMNESGRSVAEALRFYKLGLDALVIVHDEIDLAPAKFRMKTGGGTGGHNGLKSISAHLGDGYRRLRIGVGHPGRKELVPGYVLRDFAKADGDWLEPLLDAFATEAPALVEGKDAAFASRVHERLGGAGVKRAQPRAAPGRPASAAPATEHGPAADVPASLRGPSGPFAALANFLRK